jgi:Na+-transporting methylmalonyl-CoA/oxaloacetate decarboxylase gamma subunit
MPIQIDILALIGLGLGVVFLIPLLLLPYNVSSIARRLEKQERTMDSLAREVTGALISARTSEYRLEQIASILSRIENGNTPALEIRDRNRLNDVSEDTTLPSALNDLSAHKHRAHQ